VPYGVDDQWSPNPSTPNGPIQANAFWKASPMAYRFDGKELVGVAAGSNILAIGLPE
jgi:hypothetical protein